MENFENRAQSEEAVIREGHAYIENYLKESLDDKKKNMLMEMHQYLSVHLRKLSLPIVEDYRLLADSIDLTHENFFNNMHNLFPVNKGQETFLNDLYERKKDRYEKALEVQKKLDTLSKNLPNEDPIASLNELQENFKFFRKAIEDIVPDEVPEKYIGEVKEKVNTLVEDYKPKSEVPMREDAKKIFEDIADKGTDLLKIPTETNFRVREDRDLLPFYLIFYQRMRAKGYTHQEIRR